jgi:hypothetical protein
MTVRLGHPVIIFIHSLALLLIGVAIGMHWHQSRSSAIWIAVSGALLIVINEMITGFVIFFCTARWIHKQRHSGGG